MTKLTKSRLLAELGVTTVSRIFNEAGATAEVVVNDFGEDLLVQTQLQGEVDHFTILVQVKATVLKRRVGGGYSISIDVAHLYRWASHLQEVLICVYDHGTGNVYAINPKYMFSLWELSTTDRRTLSLEFNDGNRMDVHAVSRVIWSARINYYSALVGWFQNAVEALDDLPNVRRRVRSFLNERNLVVLRFLQSVGAIDGDRLPRKLREYVVNASVNFENGNRRRRNKMKCRDAVALALLGFSEDVTGQGLPRMLIDLGAHVLEGAYSQFHPEEWAEITARLTNDRAA